MTAGEVSPEVEAEFETGNYRLLSNFIPYFIKKASHP
jgi:hypothetical protein